MWNIGHTTIWTIFTFGGAMVNIGFGAYSDGIQGFKNREFLTLWPQNSKGPDFCVDHNMGFHGWRSPLGRTVNRGCLADQASQKWRNEGVNRCVHGGGGCVRVSSTFPLFV